MTTPREQAIEVMAQAEHDSYDAEVDVVPSLRQCSQTAEVMLDALLASRVPTPCATCRNTGHVLLRTPITPCPDCEPPRPLVVLYDDLEQVGHWCPWKRFIQSGPNEPPPNEKYMPLYRFQHKESEAP